MTTNLDMLSKRNIRLPNRRTSVQLEDYIWQSVDKVLSLETVSLSMLGAELDRRRGGISLASAIRLFTLIYFRIMAGSMNRELRDHNMLYASDPKQFNCFVVSLQLFSQYVQHGQVQLPDSV